MRGSWLCMSHQLCLSIVKICPQKKHSVSFFYLSKFLYLYGQNITILAKRKPIGNLFISNKM